MTASRHHHHDHQPHALHRRRVQSRVQLAIQYHDLKPSPQEAIYLNRLKYIPDNEISNRAELERGLKNSHLVKNRLSNVKPNGRQIRNIVTYARARAKSEGGSLSWIIW
jgi:hypothetical protein